MRTRTQGDTRQHTLAGTHIHLVSEELSSFKHCRVWVRQRMPDHPRRMDVCRSESPNTTARSGNWDRTGPQSEVGKGEMELIK